MAEASAAGAGAGSAVAAHRFFCHFCKGEVSPKLPVRARFVCAWASARIPLPDVLEWGLSFPYNPDSPDIGLSSTLLPGCLDPGSATRSDVPPAPHFLSPLDQLLPPPSRAPFLIFLAFFSKFSSDMSPVFMQSSSPCLFPTMTSLFLQFDILFTVASHLYCFSTSYQTLPLPPPH